MKLFITHENIETLFLTEQGRSWHRSIEVTDEFYERYRKISAEYDNMQEELEFRAMEAFRKERDWD